MKNNILVCLEYEDSPGLKIYWKSTKRITNERLHRESEVVDKQTEKMVPRMTPGYLAFVNTKVQKIDGRHATAVLTLRDGAA